MAKAKLHFEAFHGGFLNRHPHVTPAFDGSFLRAASRIGEHDYCRLGLRSLLDHKQSLLLIIKVVK